MTLRLRLKFRVTSLTISIDIKTIFRNTHLINSLFPYKDRLNRSLKSKVVCKVSCWDWDDFYMDKTKSRLHDRKTEHFKALTKSCQASAIADHITSTGHNIEWDHFEILANGRSDIHCRMKDMKESFIYWLRI